VDVSDPSAAGGPRAVSTTLDVALALVLLSAAMVVLAGIVPPTVGSPDGDAADDVAEVVATTTATVNYTLAPGAKRSDPQLVTFRDESGPQFRRTASGTLAELLAEAAVGDASLLGRSITHTPNDFERGVADATAPVLASAKTDVQIRALWRPYPDAPVRGSFVVGRSPPADADVYSATLRVPSGMRPARDRAIDAADERGYEGVAEVVAAATIDGLLPTGRLSLASRGTYPTPRLIRYRYARFGRLLNTEAAPEGGEAAFERANERLASSLATIIERDLRHSSSSPGAAARNVSVRSVRITVRTWSA